MFRSYRKIAIAVGALAIGLGMSHGAFAGAVLIEQDSSAVVDGWDISTPNGVSLTVTTNGNQIDIEKVANFNYPDQSLQIGFSPVSVNDDPATTIDITNETIFNNSGKSFGGFDFLLNNVGTTNATFGGDVFVNAIGSSAGSLNSSKDLLAYVGNQAAGATAHWGGTSASDNLLIDAPAGSVFVFDEASVPGGGSSVPLPAAAWQSLIGLATLGGLGLARRQLKQSSLAL